MSNVYKKLYQDEREKYDRLNLEVSGLNKKLETEKKLPQILKWPVSVRQQIEHLEKRFGRKV